MKFAGIIEPGVASGIVTYGKYVQGGYVVVQTIEERNSIPEGVLVDGMPVYVSEMRLLYRYQAATKKWIIEIGFNRSLITDDNTLIVKETTDANGDTVTYLAVNVPEVTTAVKNSLDLDALFEAMVSKEVVQGDVNPVSGGAVYAYIADTLGDLRDFLEDI
jgi:hypothetical protein